MAATQDNHTAKQRHWKKIVVAWQESGLSQGAFCRENAIPGSTFYWWRKKFEEKKQPLLVPVSCTPEPARQSFSSGLVIISHDGVRIEIAPDFHPATFFATM